MQTVLLIIGFALCAMALLQFGMWSTQTLSLISQTQKQFELSQELLRKQISDRTKRPKEKTDDDEAWQGFRWFRVERLVKETDVCTSVYLVPEDGKPISDFKPGQHLTLKFQVPGESKPVVRCYSLSDAPRLDYYRISVKKVPAPRGRPDLASGKVSTFINEGLIVGDRVEIKPPSGHFYLDQTATCPVVLLAGGIGVTPMVSMANHLAAQKSERPILLLYGAQNGADQAFKQHFQQLGQQHANFHMVSCYSHPTPNEVEGRDFQVSGFASVDILKKVLPANSCLFYLCGPPPFMNSLYEGLLEWGVPESRIKFEAFGPASIGKAKKSNNETSTPVASDAVIKFTKSDVTANWDGSCTSILDLAENNDVIVDSGCRAGSCGTCATTILSGKVSYENEPAECEPGKCLICIAKPSGEVELDA